MINNSYLLWIFKNCVGVFSNILIDIDVIWMGESCFRSRFNHEFITMFCVFTVPYLLTTPITLSRAVGAPTDKSASRTNSCQCSWFSVALVASAKLSHPFRNIVFPIQKHCVSTSSLVYLCFCLLWRCLGDIFLLVHQHTWCVQTILISLFLPLPRSSW